MELHTALNTCLNTCLISEEIINRPYARIMSKQYLFYPIFILIVPSSSPSCSMWQYSKIVWRKSCQLWVCNEISASLPTLENNELFFIIINFYYDVYII